MSKTSKKERVHIKLSEDEICCHPIFKYSLLFEFDIERDSYNDLAYLLKTTSLEDKYLNCLASKFYSLTRNQTTDSAGTDKREAEKREKRKIEWEKVKDIEIKGMKNVIQLMKGRHPLQKITFYFASKNITINDKRWLYQITTALKKNASQIEGAVKIAEHPPMEDKLKSRLISEELTDFFNDCWTKSNETQRKDFILSFYALANRPMSRNAFSKRKAKPN